MGSEPGTTRGHTDAGHAAMSESPNQLQRPGLSLVFTYLRAPFAAYGPLVLGAPIGLVATGFLSAGRTALYWFGGFFFWSFFEYAVHRFIQHSPRIRRYIRRWDDHAVHHARANDPEGFVNSLGESLPIAAVMGGLFIAVTPSWATGLTALAGFLAGYLLYDWLHCASHLTELHADRPWLARWSLNHLRHHWERANAYYGFTTSLWDRLLGTHPPPRDSTPRAAPRSQTGEVQLGREYDELV